MDLSLDLDGDRARCGPDCEAFISHWEKWWEMFTPEPVALMATEDYYESLRPKSKSMVRQAYRRYRYDRFVFNAHRDAVWEINRSKTETSEGPLRGWYLSYPPPEPKRRLCQQHRDEWWGGFDLEGVLRGYCRLVCLNELAVIYVFFAHADNSTGVLNGLLACMAEDAGPKYFSYHILDAGSPGRRAFKERVGFSEYWLSTRRAATG